MEYREVKRKPDRELNVQTGGIMRTSLLLLLILFLSGCFWWGEKPVYGPLTQVATFSGEEELKAQLPELYARHKAPLIVIKDGIYMPPADMFEGADYAECVSGETLSGWNVHFSSTKTDYGFKIHNISHYERVRLYDGTKLKPVHQGIVELD